MRAPQICLLTPDTPQLLEQTRHILREYAESLGIDLSFQRFDEELAALPGAYAEPRGRLLLAFVDDELAGCGAYRARAGVAYANACEMKRLYVRRAFRRFGLGRRLAAALIDGATDAGYAVMLLDTLDDMESARGLYATLGFAAVPPYYDNPVPGAIYLKAELPGRSRH